MSENSIRLDMVLLGSSYPDGWNATVDKKPCAEYASTDSKFRTKQPSWNLNADGTGTAVLQMNHVRGGGQDDVATLTAVFLPDGQLSSASQTWSLGSSWAIEWGEKVIVKVEDKINEEVSDKAGEAAAEIADLLTEGFLAPLDPVISKVATEMTSKLISSLFSELNSMLVAELGHDDGGRQTFIAVVTHNLNKLCNSIVVTPAMQLPNIGIRFDTDAFPSHLYNALHNAYGSDTAEKTVTWNNNETTDYYVAEDVSSHGNHKFRTWKPDTSNFPLKQGLYVSTKIDLKHGTAAKDGHYVVALGFSSNGSLNSAQASLEYPPDWHETSYMSPVFVGIDADVQLVANIRNKKPNYSGPNAIKLNIDAMIKCICTTNTN
jgi:hypothetical protein